MNPMLNLLLAMVGGPAVVILVLRFCSWSAHQHSRATARAIARIEAERAREAVR